MTFRGRNIVFFALGLYYNTIIHCPLKANQADICAPMSVYGRLVAA